MTDATPLASEQITQEDREAAISTVPDDGSHSSYMMVDAIERGAADDWPLVQAFARHRIAALSATPAPSDQDASQAQGEGLAERIRAAVTYQYMPMAVRRLLSEAAKALSPAPGTTAQDGVHPAIAAAYRGLSSTPTPTMPAGMVAESEAERIGLAVADLVERHLTSPHMVWGVEKMPESWLTELRSILVASLESELATAPKQAEQQGVERAIDWLVIAKLAGLHGIRYRTNTSLLQFCAALPPEYLRTIAVERCDVWMRHLRAALEDSETLETNEIKLAVEHAVQLNADVDAWEEADAALNAPTGAVEKERGA